MGVRGAVNRLACAVLLLFGCAPVSAEEELVVPEPDETPGAESVVAYAEEEPTESPPVEVEAEPLPSCSWSDAGALRAAELSPPPESGACRPAPKRRRMAELTERVREGWMYSWPDHADLTVEAGCDRLGADLSTVTLEASSGHGGSLNLVELSRRDDGNWTIAYIDYNHYYGVEKPSAAPGDPWVADATGRVALYEGTLPASTVDSLVQRAREVLTLRIEERPPPPDPDGEVFAESFGFSSRDFHVALRLVDDAGHGVERYVAGYAGSDEGQADRLVLDMAAGELWPLLDETVVESLDERTAADPDLRRLFSERLWAATTRGDEWGYWYVQERLLGLATPLGEVAHVGAMLPVVARVGESWEDRKRVLAINAIAAITGFDRRYAEDGTFRSLAEVAPEVLEACGG